jgi:putative spermidine/putrescine transport system ATP-binding protein
VQKSYDGESLVVKNLDLNIRAGEFLTLLGPSGSGKTTTLMMLAGFEVPTHGRIYLDGKPIDHVSPHERNIGMVFQNYALFPHMSVSENIAFGLEMRGISKADAVKRVGHALDLVRLADFGGRFPSQLSGGQQQRVALARALVIEPAVLLLDEPLGALDKGLRESMQVELRALQRRLGVTTVMVTHDQDEALTMADRIVVMRDGHLEQVGTATEIYQRPASKFVATFLGASNLFNGTVERRNGGETLVTTGAGLSLSVDGVAADARDVVVSVRPEAVVVNRLNGSSPPQNVPNTIVAEIEQVIYRGFISHYYLKLQDGQELIAYQQNQTRDVAAAYAQGEKVIVRWDRSSNHVIARD